MTSLGLQKNLNYRQSEHQPILCNKMQSGDNYKRNGQKEYTYRIWKVCERSTSDIMIGLIIFSY